MQQKRAFFTLKTCTPREENPVKHRLTVKHFKNHKLVAGNEIEHLPPIVGGCRFE